MMGDDQPDVRPEDALQVAQRALAKANEIAEDGSARDDDIEELTDRIVAVELRLSEIDEERPYEALTLDEKIGMVREHAFEKALDRNGRVKLDYADIKWEVFDGDPGNKHCYKLMRKAAGDDEHEQRDMNDGVPGFAVRDPAGESRHLAVDAERVKRGAAFFPGNKTLPGEGRS